jgi:hypothetical protein
MEPASQAQMQRARPVGIAVGLLIAGFGFLGLVPAWLDPAAARAPMWVIEVACGTFIVFGGAVILETLGQRIPARLLSYGLLPMLGIVAAWALLEPGGSCSVGSGLFGISVREAAPAETCRRLFGAALGVAAVLALAVGAIAWRRRAAAGKPVNPKG